MTALNHALNGPSKKITKDEKGGSGKKGEKHKKTLKEKTLITVTFLPIVLLLLLTLLTMAPSFASEPLSIQDLQHEPIQPLPWPPIQNPLKVSLGEALFRDSRLSRNNDMSCYTCHVLDKNGADGLTQFTGRSSNATGINTPTVFNSSLNHHLFWDGRASTLEEQIDYVVAGEQEFSTAWPNIIKKIKQDKDYQDKFNALFPDGITANNIRDAIATFERTLITVNSRFDRYLRGDAEAINAQEKKGYQTFKSYGCIACHQGRNVGGNLFQKLGVFKDFFKYNNNLKNADMGRFNVTGKEEDRHVFRVPSLRLVVLTAPYFHDGSAKTLSEAINIMAEYQLGRTISAGDILDIIAFLKTLPGEYQNKPVSGFNKSNINKDNASKETLSP